MPVCPNVLEGEYVNNGDFRGSAFGEGHQKDDAIRRVLPH